MVSLLEVKVGFEVGMKGWHKVEGISVKVACTGFSNSSGT